MGSYADILRIAPDRVLKKPKIYPGNHPGLEHSNFMNREAMRNEKAAYERLQPPGNVGHKGIIRCVNSNAPNDALELEFANQGNLETYIRDNPIPARDLRVKWITSLADAFADLHSRRVVHGDVALRNILVHDGAVKVCDFGEASVLPLDTDMARFRDEDGTTVRVEMMYLGCVLYSAVAWEEFKYDYFAEMRLPEKKEVPGTDGVSFGEVIGKCWAGGCASMEELRVGVYEAAERLQRVEGTDKSWTGILLLALLGSFSYVIAHWLGINS